MDLSKILCDPVSPASSSTSPLPHPTTVVDEVLTPARRKSFFKMSHGRQLSALAKYYPLPVDEEEIRRMNREHMLLKSVCQKNYVGPVQQVLSPSPHRQRRILDCGTGSGIWACEMADEFPHAQVIGVDVAPIQPDEVPENCSFEIYDITRGRQLLPYDDAHFDLLHMRSIYNGIRDYPALLREAHRVLRPGGQLILSEMDMSPRGQNKSSLLSSVVPGLHAFWSEYKRCLSLRHIDPNIPTHLRSSIQHVGGFHRLEALEAILPVGYSPEPRNQELVSIGQLTWMNYDLVLFSIRPFLLEHSGRSPQDVDQLIADAQTELYNAEDLHFSVCLHMVHATKV